MAREIGRMATQESAHAVDGEGDRQDGYDEQ